MKTVLFCLLNKMLYPNLIYSISGICDDDRGIRGLIIGKSEEQILVSFPENVDMSAQNGIFQFAEREFKYQELAVCLGPPNRCYLITEDKEEKLWQLPDSVAEFLEMNQKNVNYLLTIDNKTPHIVKVEESNTIPKTRNILWNKEVVLSNRFTADPNPDSTQFHFFESSNLEEQLNKSYFLSRGFKYNLYDCWLRIQDNSVFIFTNMKLNENEEGSNLLSLALGSVTID